MSRFANKRWVVALVAAIGLCVAAIAGLQSAHGNTDPGITATPPATQAAAQLTTTRTVHYLVIGDNTPAPKPVAHTITWEVKTDQTTNVTTYIANTTDYPAVVTPTLPGYSVDFNAVPMQTVEPSTNDQPLDTTFTVTYTPNVQKVKVVYVDDDRNGAKIDPVEGTITELTGPSGTAVNFTEEAAIKGVPATYDYVKTNNVETFDFDDAADQIIIVHVRHFEHGGELTVTRTIEYVVNGGDTPAPAPVTQPMTWKVTTCQVSGLTTYTPQFQGYPAVVSPRLPGYTVDMAEVGGTVASASSDTPTSTTVTVTYTLTKH